MKRNERNRIAKDILKSVELEDKADLVQQISAAARNSGLASPEHLLIIQVFYLPDEPTGNLDSVTGDKVVELLFKLNNEKGITLIIVTHDPDLAEMCDRQILLKDGKLVEETGMPIFSILYKQPQAI